MEDELFIIHDRLEQTHWWFRGRRKIITALIESVQPPNHGRKILDIGCGTGATIAAISDRYSCCGVDISKRAIQLGTNRYPGLDLRRIPDNLSAIQSLCQTADCILLLDILEHIRCVSLFISTIVTNMKAGSYLLITVPADPKLWSEHDEIYGHYRRYTPDSLEAVFSDLAIETIFASYFNSRLYPLIRIIRTIKNIQRSNKIYMNKRKTVDLTKIAFTAKRILGMDIQRRKTPSASRSVSESSKPFPYGVSLLALLRRRIDT